MNFQKVSLICFSAAALLFFGFFGVILVLRPEDVVIWRIFSVCMPLCSISLGLGILFLLIGFFRGRRGR